MKAGTLLSVLAAAAAAAAIAIGAPSQSVDIAASGFAVAESAN